MSTALSSLIIKLFAPNLQRSHKRSLLGEKRERFCWFCFPRFPKVLSSHGFGSFSAIILMDVFKVASNCFSGAFHAKSFYTFPFSWWRIVFPPRRVQTAMFVLQFCDRSLLFAPSSTVGHIINSFSLLVFRSRTKMAAKATQDQSCDYKYQGPEKYHYDRD